MTDALAISDRDINTLGNLLSSPTIPDRYETVPDLVATVLLGRELGMTPLTAINELFIVNGKVSMAGKTMLALVQQAGHRIHIATSREAAVATGYRRQEDGTELEVGTFSFDMEDAELAGLAGTNAWATYPADMLGWKAVARCARFAFPECITGWTTMELAGEDAEHEDLEEAVLVLPDEVDTIEVDDELGLEEIADALDAEVVST